MTEPNESLFDKLSPVPELLEALRAGQMIILVDEEDRENEGDLLIAAQFATPQAINFMATHARGLVCLTLTQERCQELNLSLMTSRNGTPFGTNFTVPIEAASGVTTGISAADRAHTVAVAIDPASKPSDLINPGHIFPLQAVKGGVLVRAGHTEAGCDLTALAGLQPAAVICEILKEDGTMARLPDLVEYAKHHDLKIGTIASLIQYRSQTESMIKRMAQKDMTTPWGKFKAVVYQDLVNKAAHVALVHGEIKAEQETLVRVHEPVSVLDILDVDAGLHSWTVAKAATKIQQSKAGVLVLLNCDVDVIPLESLVSAWQNDENKHQEKLSQQDEEHSHLRDYGIGAQILKDLNVGVMCLLAKPRKMSNMSGYGLTIKDFISSHE